MAIGLRFRGRGGGKSLAPDSRASSRRSKRQGASRSAGVNRGDQAAQWKRGEATLGSGKRDAASLFFGPANTGKKKAGAPASALAVLTGRGAYMKKYGKERKKIFHSFMKEKGKMLARQRRQSAKIRTDLRRQDVDVYKEYKIAAAMRPGKRGLTEDRQKKLAQKAARKIMQKVRVAQRGELRKLQRSREIELREMKHKLREEGG